MNHLKYFIWMFQVDLNIFKKCILQVIDYFELSNEGFIKQE